MADNPYAKYANPYSGMVQVGVDPNKPLELKSKQIGVQKGEAELALTPYQLRKQKADAEKAEIDARNAREQYAAQHPQASTSGLYGQDFLKTLSPSDQNMVKALSEGRLAFPQGAALRAPFWQEKLSQVAQYDPTFDATDFNARAKGRANAISGKLGQSNNALNTAVGHLGELYSQIDGTASHGGFPFATTVNSVENWYSKHQGDKGVTNFEQTAGLVADELEAAYRNGGGAEAGVVRSLRSLDPNMSREQKEGVIRNAIKLLSSKIAANVSQYNFGTGGKPTWDMLDPHTKKILDTVAPDVRDEFFAPPSNSGTAPPPPGFTPPPTGPTGGLPNPSSNGFDDSPDPQSAAFWDNAVRSGTPYRQALQQWQSQLGGKSVVTPPDPDLYGKAVDYVRKYPNAPYSPVESFTRTPIGAVQGVANAIAQNPGGAFAAHYGNAALADIPGRLAGDRGQLFNAVSNQQNPGASFLGDLGGTVAGAVLTTKALKAASPALGPIGRWLNAEKLATNPWTAEIAAPTSAARTGAVADTAFGTVSGAANNPDHAVAGGLGGGLAMLAGNAAGRYILAPGIVAAGDTRLGQAAVNGARQVKGMFGGGPAQPFVPPAPLDSGQQVIMGQTNKIGIPDLRAKMQEAQGLGLPFAWSDADPRLRLLAGAATRKSPDVRTLAENVLIPRQMGQGERAIGAINNHLAPVGDVPTLQANILKDAQAKSRPLYEEAKSQPAPELTANPALKDVLDRPAAQSAVRKGYETALNNGEDVGTLTYATDANGNQVAYGNPSWNILHYARQELDKSGETAVRHALDRQIAGLNPGFKAADAKYSGIVKGSEALQSGADATGIKVTPEATQRALAGVGDNAPLFQRGYASNLADTIERQRLSGNPYDLVNGSMGQQSKLGIVFHEGAPRFSRTQALEGDMSKTAHEALGGSPTAARMQADKAFDNPLGDGALELGLMGLTGMPPKGLIKRGIQMVADAGSLGLRGAKAKADQIGPILLNPDPAANLATLDELARIHLARQAYQRQIGAAGGMFAAPISYAPFQGR